ncbi:hypothetical protein CTEN210_13515 [Chaetoceros tenuissimus]|uniref:G-protein coupled receptors family 2 profile 2 domain-containing protein n=1 Tax=Chaetoceros tenuissimus TaxID=426638 RepID=A0AAD3D3H3_9STRA|nr:hypothetical protein CTEN210_13515 [Chaetoceros tenuissimus]
MVPRDTSPIASNYAVGNVITCDIQGFMQQVGSLASLLYNLSLSVYYLAILKYNMREKDIAKKLEPFLHIIPNGFALGSGIFLAIEKQYAPLQNAHTCWLGVYPQGCLGNLDVECERGSSKTLTYAKWLGVIPFCATYFVMIVAMMVIIYHVVQQKRKGDRWRIQQDSRKTCYGNLCSLLCFLKKEESTNHIPQTSHPQTSHHSMISAAMTAKQERMRQSLRYSQIAKYGVCEIPDRKVASIKSSNSSPDEENIIGAAAASRSGNKHDPLAFNMSKVKHMIRKESNLRLNEEIILSKNNTEKQDKPLRNKSVSTRRSSTADMEEATKVATTQCLLYIMSFFLCYTFVIIARIYGITSRPAPFPVLILSRFFLPIQGFFVILVYSRPHIRSIRVNTPSITWSQAFMIALKGGGDNDNGSRAINNTNLIIDPEGIDAPRLPEEERKRRQEIIRQAYLRRASTRSSYVSLPTSLLETPAHDEHSTREEHDTVVGEGSS